MTRVTKDYTAEMEHDGRSYSIRVPDLELLECGSCKTLMFTDESRKRLTYALRTKAGLLLPEEIREQRVRLDLSQEALAKALRVAKETVCRWETGNQIQQRAMDLLLRLFFDVPAVRSWLGSGALVSHIKPGTLTMHYGGTAAFVEFNVWSPELQPDWTRHGVETIIAREHPAFYYPIPPEHRIVDESVPAAIAKRIKEPSPF